MKYLIHCLLIVASLALTGCGSMSLSKEEKIIDFSKGSVMLLTVSMKNSYKPNYPLTSYIVSIKKPDGRYLNLNSGPEGLFAAQSVPGAQKLVGIGGTATKFLITGAMGVSLEADVNLPENSVIYLGNIFIDNIERKDRKDQASGMITPLIDQQVTGFGNGTPKIEIRDQFDKDIAYFKLVYGSLKNQNIINQTITSIKLDSATGSVRAPVLIELKR